MKMKHVQSNPLLHCLKWQNINIHKQVKVKEAQDAEEIMRR